MNKETKTLKSSNGTSTISGIVYHPTNEAKALIQISHGMVEHIGRYDDFMSFLAKEGYAVCGHDHIGHGKSVGADETFGFFKEENGDQALVEDIYNFGQLVRKDFPTIPHILIGHSMGSFIARICVATYKDAYDGFIFSGTGGPTAIANIGVTLASLAKKVGGEKKHSEN